MAMTQGINGSFDIKSSNVDSFTARIFYSEQYDSNTGKHIVSATGISIQSTVYGGEWYPNGTIVIDGNSVGTMDNTAPASHSVSLTAGSDWHTVGLYYGDNNFPWDSIEIMSNSDGNKTVTISVDFILYRNSSSPTVTISGSYDVDLTYTPLGFVYIDNGTGSSSSSNYIENTIDGTIVSQNGWNNGWNGYGSVGQYAGHSYDSNYVAVVQLQTPDFSGTSTQLSVILQAWGFVADNGNPLLRWALCTSDENKDSYITVGEVADEHQIATGTIVFTETSTPTPITINTSDIQSNTVYYLFLWGYSDDDGRVELITTDNHSIMLTYIDGEIASSGFSAYQVYIDNGTGWDLYMPYIDNGTSWDILG